MLIVYQLGALLSRFSSGTQADGASAVICCHHCRGKGRLEGLHKPVDLNNLHVYGLALCDPFRSKVPPKHPSLVNWKGVYLPLQTS